MPTSLEIVQASFLGLWDGLIAFLPSLVGALVVLIVGFIFAVLLRRLVEKVIEFLRIDDLAIKLDLKRTLEQYGIRLHIGRLLGWIIKWFLIVVFLIASTDILGWDQVTSYLQEVVFYIPNVIIAVIILLAGILLATFVQGVVKSTVEAAKLASADFLAGISKWAILIFTFMAALVQLQIAEDLIRVLFTGLVAMLALAGGLAFGLGGKEHAGRFLTRLRKDISSER